jgi:hypothetical protein
MVPARHEKPEVLRPLRKQLRYVVEALGLPFDGWTACSLARMGGRGANTRYHLTPAQWGAGGGRATHKEPTRAPSADATETQASKMAATSPPLALASQCMSGRQPNNSKCQG